MEELKSPKKFLLVSYILNIIAIILFFSAPQLAVVFAGIASAIYHVSGGSICAEENKAFHIGLFASPGVAGLIAGGFIAFREINILPWLLIAAIGFFILLFFIPGRKYNSLEQDKTESVTQKIIFDRHDLIMILLLTVISLRSVIWNVFQLAHENNYQWLIAIAISAFAGKLIGGWAADKVGWRLYTYFSLIVATPLISFFRNEIVLFCIGIGLLQSSIPATTSLLIHSLKGKKERAIGLSFGTAILAGAIVFYSPVRNLLDSNVFLSLLTLLMIFFLFFSGKKRVFSLFN